MIAKLLNKLGTRNVLWGIAIANIVLWAGVGAWLAMQPKQAPVQADKPAPVAHIRITDAGFVPAELVVVPGTKVIWTNETAAPRRVGANPYPDRSQLPDLNSGVIAPEATFGFTFTKAGDIGYTDYTDPQQSGSVYVK